MSNNIFDKLANTLGDLIDDRIGIINTIKEHKAPNGSPPFFRYYAYMSNTKVFCDQENYRVSIGVATTRKQALAKAIGEGIERYCSAIYFKKDLSFCSYQDANFNCVNPNEFVGYEPKLYEKNDFAWKPFKETTKVRWTTAIDITNNKTITHVPAAYVYLPYIYGDSEEKIIQSISTGLACHMSYELAALTAIFEVVERDAFMIFWRNRISPPKINIDTLPFKIQHIINEYQSANYKVTLLYITTDIKIPTVLAILRCTLPKNPSLIVAASCKLSPELAVVSALEELELTRSHCIELLRDEQINSNTSYDQFKYQKDHLLFWSRIENLPLINFLFESNTVINIDQMPNLIIGSASKELDSIINIFTTLNLRILLANITTSDLSHYGFHVIRAIIPKLHPLTFGYKNDEFQCQRLLSVPKTLGFKNALLSNTYLPHPFP